MINAKDFHMGFIYKLSAFYFQNLPGMVLLGELFYFTVEDSPVSNINAFYHSI